MGTWHSRMLAAAGWLFVIATTTAAAPPSAEQLQAWVRELDAEDYSVREEASSNLIAAGEASIDVLATGAESTSPEAAWRASSALEMIALSGDEATLSRVSSALLQLSQRGKPGVRLLAASLRAKQGHLRHDRAAAKVRGLGGKLSGDGEAEGALQFVGPGIQIFEAQGIDIFLGGVLPQVAGAVEVAAPVKEQAAAEELPATDQEEDEAAQDDAVNADKQPADPDPPPALPEAGGPVPVEAANAGIGDAFVAQDLVLAEAEGGDVDAPNEGLSETLVLDGQWQGGDAGLAALKELPSIVSLSIRDAKLTDAALVHIAGLPRLAQLSLQGKTEISAEGLSKFRKARPATMVYARGEALLGVNAEMEGPCVLSSVANGSGAAEAGLSPGDEILAVGGMKVRDFSDLTIAVFTHKAGEKLLVEYRRGGEQKTAEVVLKDRMLVERVTP